MQNKNKVIGVLSILFGIAVFTLFFYVDPILAVLISLPEILIGLFKLGVTPSHPSQSNKEVVKGLGRAVIKGLIIGVIFALLIYLLLK